MQRTFNYTGRRKIEASELQIDYQIDEQGMPFFDVSFNLDKDHLADHCSIYIEAYNRNTLQRFCFGTVGAIQNPEDRRLSEIDLSGPTLFRAHIVDGTEHVGRLVASANRLKPQSDDDEDRRSSLFVLRARPLGEQTWKVEFETGGKPELVINSRIPSPFEQLKTNALFQSLILPAAFRQILMFYILDENEEDEIVQDWLNFAESIFEERPEGGDASSLMNWVDDVVDRFSDSFSLCSMLINRMENS